MIGFALFRLVLLRLVISSENLQQSLNQSDAGLKTCITCFSAYQVGCLFLLWVLRGFQENCFWFLRRDYSPFSLEF